MPTFEELKSRDVRQYWEDEAQDFTPWLADEIEASSTSQLEDVMLRLRHARLQTTDEVYGHFRRR